MSRDVTLLLLLLLLGANMMNACNTTQCRHRRRRPGTSL